MFKKQNGHLAELPLVLSFIALAYIVCFFTYDYTLKYNLAKDETTFVNQILTSREIPTDIKNHTLEKKNNNTYIVHSHKIDSNNIVTLLTINSKTQLSYTGMTESICNQFIDNANNINYHMQINDALVSTHGDTKNVNTKTICKKENNKIIINN